MPHHAQGAPAPARSSLPALRHLPVVDREPLSAGDRVRTLHAGHIGSVMRVYPDGSACLTWDDKPAPFGLGHERVPRSCLLVLPSISTTESEGGEL